MMVKNMAITSKPSIKDGCLMVRTKVVLTRVPESITVSPLDESGSAAFIGATQSTPSSRHVFSLGILEEFKFLTLFRFKIWWMIPRVGKSASEIPMEAQMLILEATEESALHNDISCDPTTTVNTTFYILFLPVLDGLFRSSLQGTRQNELQLCIESGDTNVQTSQALEALFVNSGDNPFVLIKNSIKILEKNKRTFSHIDNKKIPEHLDWFGWCTWDAFYKKVNPQGIQDGLRSLQEGGCSPKFLIIDDGWQDTINEFHKEGEPLVEETQFAARLIDIKESSKFKSSDSGSTYADLHEFVNDMKDKYGVKLIYMWHALAGYWGGVLPSSETMKKYNPKIAYPIQSPGNVGNLRDIAMDSLEKYGVGVIDPKKVFEFYNDLHGYLASCGINGVKVDIQNVLETLGSGFGGRVLITRQYQEALEESIAQNFRNNNLICSMSHNSDSLYSSKTSAVARASEDFMPREPTLQTLHVASVAFNSLLLGEIVVPDWDMFHSKHETAEFHAAARALGGCAVYVSDTPGNHDIEVLRKLVLPDGSVLRARYAGRPTRDCLFEDPVMDGKSLLKIWNLNNLSGIVGVFNCQGAGHWPLKQLVEDSSNIVSKFSSISGHLSPLDVEFLEEIAGENWNGNCAVYDSNSGSLSVLPSNGKLKVTLATLKCEIYTVSPIRGFGHGVHFAPIGLLNMYNSGGALESLRCKEESGCRIKVGVRGVGKLGAYSSLKPRYCMIGMKEEEFTYNSEDKLLTVKLQGECNPRDVEFVY